MGVVASDDDASDFLTGAIDNLLHLYLSNQEDVVKRYAARVVEIWNTKKGFGR